VLHVERGPAGPDGPSGAAPPIYHRREQRIRAHVLLCWLALPLVRFIETRTVRTRAVVRDDLTGPAGTVIPDQRTHHRHPRGACRAGDHPAAEVLRLDPTPHGARRDRHRQVLPSRDPPGSQVSLPADHSRKKWGPTVHVTWCCG